MVQKIVYFHTKGQNGVLRTAKVKMQPDRLRSKVSAASMGRWVALCTTVKTTETVGKVFYVLVKLRSGEIPSAIMFWPSVTKF